LEAAQKQVFAKADSTLASSGEGSNEEVGVDHMVQ
jgi:hypothetical protein